MDKVKSSTLCDVRDDHGRILYRAPYSDCINYVMRLFKCDNVHQAYLEIEDSAWSVTPTMEEK